MSAFIQFLYAHRAEIFGFIVALDQALAATGKVKANSTGQLFLHSFIASIQAQKTAQTDTPTAEAPVAPSATAELTPNAPVQS